MFNLKFFGFNLRSIVLFFLFLLNYMDLIVFAVISSLIISFISDYLKKNKDKFLFIKVFVVTFLIIYFGFNYIINKTFEENIIGGEPPF